jgi:hypothetical protein
MEMFPSFDEGGREDKSEGGSILFKFVLRRGMDALLDVEECADDR